LKQENHWTKSSTARGGSSRHWYTNPRYWGEWYMNCANANKKQQLAVANSTLSRRAKPKCGFCGEEDHNRRKCAKLLAYRQKANLANQAFRRYIYDEMVSNYGLSAGALVEVQQKKYDYKQGKYILESNGICTITSVNWDTMSITSDWASRDKYGRQRLARDLHSPITLEYVSGAGNRGRVKIELGKIVTSPVIAEQNLHSRTRSMITQVISPSSTPLDESWVEDGRKDAFEWLTTKRSADWLSDHGVDFIVDKWYQRYLEQEEAKSS